MMSKIVRILDNVPDTICQTYTEWENSILTEGMSKEDKEFFILNKEEIIRLWFNDTNKVKSISDIIKSLRDIEYEKRMDEILGY